MGFLEGVLARMGLTALSKLAVHYWYRLRYLFAKKVEETLTNQDSKCLENAKTEKEIEKCATDRANHI